MPQGNAQNVTERTNAVIATVKAIRLVSMQAYHNAHIAEVQEFAQLVISLDGHQSLWEAGQAEFINNLEVAIEVARQLKSK